MHFRKKAAAAVCCSALAIAALPAQALALEGDTGTISVRQNFSSNIVNGDRTVEYALTRVSEDAPMPEGSNGNTYKFELNDDDESEIRIVFSETGDYEYTLTCSEPDTEGFTFDTQTYRVQVNALVGSDAAMVAPLIFDQDGNKVKVAKWDVDYVYSGGDSNGDGGGGNGTDQAGTNGSGLPKMEDVLSGFIYGVALGVGLIVIVAAVKRRKKDDEPSQ